MPLEFIFQAMPMNFMSMDLILWLIMFAFIMSDLVSANNIELKSKQNKKEASLMKYSKVKKLSSISIVAILSDPSVILPILMVLWYFEAKKGKHKYKYMNLFLSFDPYTSIKFMFIQELNWLVLFIPLMLMSVSFYVSSTRINLSWNYFVKFISSQFSINLKTSKDSANMFMIFFFFVFLSSNILGLIPNMFTTTSHMTFNLIISLSTWTGFFIYGWWNFSNKMFAHLVPNSTPNMLISFMVLIELTSNLIRPWTLSIRLVANMVSGHLLLTLMGNSMVDSNIFIVSLLVMGQTLLSTLEISVAMIQAYVFCMLMSLYSAESDY